MDAVSYDTGQSLPTATEKIAIVMEGVGRSLSSSLTDEYWSVAGGLYAIANELSRIADLLEEKGEDKS